MCSIVLNTCNIFIMAQDVQLSSQQTEKLLQFQELTGIDNMERCQQVLEDHNWNLEVAVQDTLNIRDQASTYENSNHSIAESPRGIFWSLQRFPRSGIIGWGFSILFFPFQCVYYTFIRLARYTLSFIRADLRRVTLDPQVDVLRFIEKFESTYSTNHPVFYRGTYYQAINEAKQELRFLLVYLHCEDHQDSNEFCRNVLQNSELIDFVNNTFLFWACSVNTPEGYRVSQALRENTYPFLAVIVLRDNNMTVVARIEGPLEPLSLIRRLQVIVNENEVSLANARRERIERSLNQTIRQQQDEAYKESLRADQEKEKKRREEQQLRERLELEERDKKIEEQKRKEEIRRKKIEYASLIPEEPPIEDPFTIRLVIKLPSGTRLERRFCANDSLKYLFYFVFCHAESPDAFQIVTNFPRRIVPCEPTANCEEPPTFADFNFGKSEMLFVHDLEA